MRPADVKVQHIELTRHPAYLVEHELWIAHIGMKRSACPQQGTTVVIQSRLANRVTSRPGATSASAKAADDPFGVAIEPRGDPFDQGCNLRNSQFGVQGSPQALLLFENDHPGRSLRSTEIENLFNSLEGRH